MATRGNTVDLSVIFRDRATGETVTPDGDVTLRIYTDRAAEAVQTVTIPQASADEEGRFNHALVVPDATYFEYEFSASVGGSPQLVRRREMVSVLTP